MLNHMLICNTVFHVNMSYTTLCYLKTAKTNKKHKQYIIK